ncbi:isochorismatase family cysteine hydrolase [Mycolicibacterium sp. 050158]|uniref:cysteine hydrolase family protein n=1 Tax=Mycolicibacterium sp. 050158 TaxID=3090602 RepID=UPI00299EFC0B|nr:isochorismatase family cysteine hydrolase [Mycolicibacterium sp. 050158]MDX1893048.1 isochorismatase family cysteine hydrolase [Mycolicibacterium sp. 050158]
MTALTRVVRRSVRYGLLAVLISACGHTPTQSPPPALATAPARSASPGIPLAVDPERTALLVMDMQQAITDMAGASAEEPLTRTAEAERSSRRAGVRVIFVATAFTPGHLDISPNDKAFARFREGNEMLIGSPETRLDPQIAPLDGEPVIVKHEVGAFSAPPLQQELRARGIDTLVLTGIATSGVVVATAEAAADLDYRVIVLSDCVADPDPEVNRVLLDKVLPIEADVVDSTKYETALNA